MTEQDFKDIKFFTYKECAATGADMDSLSRELIKAFDGFRSSIGQRIKLVEGGLNSGGHSTKSYHYKSKAIDWCFAVFKVCTTEMVGKVIQYAAAFGFRGIGVYFNLETGYIGFHFDTRTQFTMWKAYKKRTKDSWSYSPLDIGTLFR